MSDFHMMLDHYCYGPADLLQIKKGDSTMWLSLRDSNGCAARAEYRGCVYWRLSQAQIHLSLVRRVSAQEIADHPGSATMKALRKNANDVPGLLRQWEQDGLSFYLHSSSSPGEEFLVVARSLRYQEDGSSEIKTL